MGATCCGEHKPVEHEINSPEKIGDVQNQLTQQSSKKTFLRVGPDLFISMKREDIYSIYSVGKVLGEGAYGTVSMVTHRRLGLLRAMKAIRKDALFEEEQQQLFAEMQILKDLDHPNIVKLYELFQDEKYYYLITEYLPGGELFDRIQKFKSYGEQDAVRLMKQVMSAVAYCHSKNIVHRDLKPENIIFNTDEQTSDLKVIDFGTSRKFDNKDNQKMTKRLGTPYYIAPEVLTRNYNEKCDIWSCGVILYILLAGYPPFNGRNENEIFQKIMSGRFQFHADEWSKVSQQAKDLITKMLNKDVELRPSAEQVLQDPWMQKENNELNLIDGALLKNLTEFRAKSKIKQALLTFMASQMISQKEVEQLQRMFRALDENGDGTLSRDELITAFQKKINDQDKIVENMETRINNIIDQIDINQSGKIDYTEFIMACLYHEKLITTDRIKQAFKILDLDGDQYISKEELQTVMEGVDDQIWMEFLDECDQDKDGKISEQEFIDILINKI
ncbi:hypothetical protein pb186bvf_012099 [Paramecium bursaria]